MLLSSRQSPLIQGAKLNNIHQFPIFYFFGPKTVFFDHKAKKQGVVFVKSINFSEKGVKNDPISKK